MASGGAEQPPSGINQPDSLSDAKPIPVVVPSPEQSDLEDLAKLAELENDARAAGTAEQGKTLEIRAAELLKDGTAMVLRPDAPDRPSGYGVVAGDKPHETEVRPIRAGKTYYFEKFVDPSDPSKGAIIRTAKSKSGEKIYMKNSLLLKILVPEELLPELAPKPAADEGTLLPKLGDTDESTKNSLGI